MSAAIYEFKLREPEPQAHSAIEEAAVYAVVTWMLMNDCAYACMRIWLNAWRPR